MLALTFGGALLTGGCDGKLSTPLTPSASSSGAKAVTRTTTAPDSFPAGIIPANAGAAAVASGASASGGVTGNAGTGAPAKGGTPAPATGDGAVPPKQ